PNAAGGIDAQQSQLQRGNPDRAAGVFGDAVRVDAVDCTADVDGDEPLAVQISERESRRDPYTSAAVFEDRVDAVLRQSAADALSHVAGAVGAGQRRHALVAEDRELAVLPSVEAFVGANPDRAVPTGENRYDPAARQTLLGGECRHRR